jgi:predicted Zn finger-like uncharacterized protein
MRIACPNCQAEYDVPDAMLAAGPRLLKCARCGHSFQAGLPGTAPAAAPPPATPLPAPPPRRSPPEQLSPKRPPEPALREAPPEPAWREPPPHAFDPDRPPPTRGPGRHSPMDGRAPAAEDEEEDGSTSMRVLAWLVSFAALGFAGWALVQYRGLVMEAFPAATRLYQALGLA